MLQTRRFRSCQTAFIVALTTIAGSAFAGPGTLGLRAGQIDLAPLPNAMARAANQRPAALGRRSVIQLDGPMTTDRRQALTDAGVRLGDYIPDHAYLADLSAANAGALRRLGFVTFAGAYRTAWKIDPHLGNRTVVTADRLAIQAQGLVAMDVYLFPGSPVQATLDAVATVAGVTPLAEDWDGSQVFVTITAPVAAARNIASIGEVQWIEPTPEITLRNATVRGIVQSGSSASTPIYAAGLRGEGQLIAVMDGKVDVNHCSFSDPEGDPFGPDHRKIEAYNPTTGTDLHGTHVTGTALGDGGNAGDARGVAYRARLVFNSPPTSFAESKMFTRLTKHDSQGARIHTNSWGNDATTQYDGLSRAIDNFSWLNDDNLVIFASTNQSLLKNPENAKNCLAVGATSDGSGLNNHCIGGRGPTIDGRRKPEIFAPGCGIRSSNRNTSCSTTSLSGTSMAAPAIAGSAALTRQYYTDGYYPSGTANAADEFIPTGALIKATLLNSTADMTGVAGYPSDTEGWGRVQLDNSLAFAGGPRSLLVHEVRNADGDAMSTSDFYEMNISVLSGNEPLKVTLVFHDAPGAVGSNPSSINDLDLEVISTGLGITFLGNDFAAGQSTIGGSPDPINNVEMVLLNTPVAGNYTIRIKATAVNVDTQGYAVVVSGDIEAATTGPCSDADFAEPYGVLDFFDVSAFLTAYGNEDPSADLNDDGVWDFFDVSLFLSLFGAGCP